MNRLRDRIERIVNQSILNYVNLNMPRDARVVWVTEIAGCLLRSFLQRVHPSPIEDIRQAFKLIAGEAIHRVVQRGLNGDSEIEKQIIMPVDDFEIRGRIDAVVDGVAIEFKTCIDHGAPSDPLPVHVRQLQYYLNMSGIERGMIVYIDVKRGKVTSFEIRRDPKFLDELITRSRFFVWCLKRVRPPRPEKAPYLCSFCPFYMWCSSGKYLSIVERIRRRRMVDEGLRMDEV